MYSLARLETGIMGSNHTQGIDVWYVYVFILCLCCPVCRMRPCRELITRPRSLTVCKMIMKLKISDQGTRGGAVEPVGEKKNCMLWVSPASRGKRPAALLFESALERRN
jgi:hypothetical protein